MKHRIPHINHHEYQQLIQHAKPLKAQDDKGDVIINADGLVIKHIYPRQFWSSATLWPYALRFKRNSHRLKQLGIKAPDIEKIYYFAEKKCHLVIYPFVTGTTVRNYALQGNFEAFARLPEFIAQLHHHGIYFRDLHTNNIVAQPDGSFALIDIISVRTSRNTLNPLIRARNIAHLFKINEDKPLLAQFGIHNFLQSYLSAANLTPQQTQKFFEYMKHKRVNLTALARSIDVHKNLLVSDGVSSRMKQKC